MREAAAVFGRCLATIAGMTGFFAASRATGSAGRVRLGLSADAEGGEEGGEGTRLAVARVGAGNGSGVSRGSSSSSSDNSSSSSSSPTTAAASS